MSVLLDDTLRHLRTLVGFDTRNPPRAISPTGGIFEYLCAQLPGFDCTVTDHGAGAVSLFAVRGQPRILFNVHLDTVPDSPAWSASPFELRVTDERAIGLGACDIKGAAAALLAAANASNGDAALLFTSDEEANDARCIAGILSAVPSPPGRRWRAAPDEGSEKQRIGGQTEPSPPTPLPAGEERYDTVIVAEPTRGKAVLAHRGISSVLMRFAGRAGHASGAQGASDNALHQAVRWSARALDHVASFSGERFDDLTGLRFNIGRIEGGIKANVIAPAAQLRFGFRPLPSMDVDALLATLRGFALAEPAEFCETFRGAPLPAGAPGDAANRRRAAHDTAVALGLPIGKAVDFWTEAALFSAAGYNAFVYGPGDIAQAHSADEWVALDELHAAAQTYLNILEKRP